MRVLMLASYFPKPDNPVMGNWALSQAQAFLRAGMQVSVVSGTSWLPKVLARSRSTLAYANCPSAYRWGDLDVSYPRWPLYHFSAIRPLLLSNPALLVGGAWLAIRGHLLRAVKELRPDVIYAHHTQVNGYLAWRLSRITGIPYVVTDHDFGELQDCRSHAARYRFFSPVVQGSSRMVAVASRMARIVEEIFPGARALTVHNGSDPPSPELFLKTRPPALKDKVVVFSACAFYERKGIPLLVRAFSSVASRFPDAILRIAGDGATRSDIEKAVHEADLGQRIQLLGQLPHGEVLQEMVWADLFALPGWDEPFATAFTEALSAGCPIIYASDGGITDVVADGVHGVAVKPRDEASIAAALDMLLSDKFQRQKMSGAARELFQSRLLWDHNAANMKSVFAAAMVNSEKQGRQKHADQPAALTPATLLADG